MKYACLIYQDEVALQNASKEERSKMTADYLAITDVFKERGQYISSSGLAPTTSATTVRVRNGKTLTTDGPFAETKEQLGGIYFIEAKDLNDAIQIAAKLPSAQWGCIEVRPAWGYSS